MTDASLGIKYAAEQYLKMMGISSEKPHELTAGVITIKHLNSVVVDGNTYYYIVSESDEKYSIKASVDLSVTPFMEIDQTYKIEYYNDGQINVIEKIEIDSID